MSEGDNARRRSSNETCRIPVVGVIATRNRSEVICRTFDSLLRQEFLPAELLIVDASTSLDTKRAVDEFRLRLPSNITLQWLRAEVTGAAAQRNQGITSSQQPYIWFSDDDVLYQSQCLELLWKAIQSDSRIGGVSAMIDNQQYSPPGLVSRVLFNLVHGRNETSFAGKVIGPAINLLPENRADLSEVVSVEWLNTTCTLYRRECLPTPPFDTFFTGYSLMEDLAMSLRTAQNGWGLANVKAARIYHDSQQGEHKCDVAAIAAMELRNRYYIMAQVMGRRRLRDLAKLFLFELFQLVSTARQQPKTLGRMIGGKIMGLRHIFAAASSGF